VTGSRHKLDEGYRATVRYQRLSRFERLAAQPSGRTKASPLSTDPRSGLFTENESSEPAGRRSSRYPQVNSNPNVAAGDTPAASGSLLWRGTPKSAVADFGVRN
jgi:hypothetical protein